MNEDEFVNEVKKIAVQLEKGERQALLNLRKLVRPMNIIIISNTWKDNKKKFLFTYLNTLIDDFWRNLAVDNTYTLDDKEQTEFSKTLGLNIKNLLQLIKENDVGNGYIAISNMNASYFELLNRIELKAYQKE